MTNREQGMKLEGEVISRMVLTVILTGMLMLGFDIGGGYALAGNTHIWHTETVDSSGSVGWHPSIVLDSNDSPHISYHDFTNGDLKYAYYDGTWHTETVDNAVNVGTYTSIALDRGDSPHISYFDGYKTDLKYAYYDGTNWHTERVDSAGHLGMYTSIALDNDDNPHISYYDYTINGDLKYAYHDGTIWNIETADSSGDVGLCTSIALDSSDNPHISYFDVTKNDLKYAYNDGTSWHIETVDSSGSVGVGTFIALDSSNAPHISYVGSLKYAYYDGTWHIETVDVDCGWFTSIALDSSDNPHVSYEAETNGDLKYAYYDGTWHIERVDSEDCVGLYPSIALDSSDNPRISYSDATNEDLKYAYTIPAYDLTITTTDGGTTDPAPGTYTYPCDSSVEVTAIPDPDYVFDHWELDGEDVGSANPYSVLMDDDHTLHAVFVQNTYCQVSPTSLYFGMVAVGSYLDKNFTITNIGEEILTGTVTESCDHYDIVSGGGAYSLDPGDWLIVTVRFEPASPGEYNCIIETGNALCSDVSCTGVGTHCQVWPTSLSFGWVNVGSYLDKNFTITNLGEGMLTGTVTESCDHYSIVSGGGAYSLGAGESVTVTVRFGPASLGQHNCTIETGNDLCSDVFCTGVGQSPCQVSPTSLNFGTIVVGSYLDKSFTVSNIGEGSLTGTISESCDHYNIVSGEGAYILAGGEYLTVTVRFEPASVGQHDCIIETGNALCSDVSCSGVGAGYWYWKLPYEDYAPSGVPDIDQKQDNWFKYETLQYSLCGPCAVANCFKWFDSKYNLPPGLPGDGIDMFPLVRDYMDDLPPWNPGGVWDDHDPWNVDHSGTSWGPTAGAPPPTAQPFAPGPQPQPSGMPAWGELVERLAWYFDTDGIRTTYCQHSGTNVMQMQEGIDMWLESETFQDGSTLADSLCEVTIAKPTFALVESLVEKSDNVILLLGFWYTGEAPIQQEFQLFIRGDIYQDGIINLNDVTACYLGGPFPCDDASDVNDDGMLGTADCVYLYNFIMFGGPPPPPPFPDCGMDPTPDDLGCINFYLCDRWWRVGGHYVTVAGVNSEEQTIAFSDPFIDAAELGIAQGRVGDGSLIEHVWGEHDPTVHNDEGNVSHDVYVVVESDDPGGRWHLVNYAVSSDPYYWTENFSAQNVPEEFLAVTQPWDGVSPIYTEVEYCIHISPWDYRGDVNHSGAVEAGDVVYLIGYLYRGGPSPDPYLLGDVNCDGVVTAGDIVRLLNYLFRGWSVPRCCDP